jgi:hypothetical protein
MPPATQSCTCCSDEGHSFSGCFAGLRTGVIPLTDYQGMEGDRAFRN